MIVAGVVIETVPQAAPAVARRLGARSDLRVEGHDGDGRVAAVWWADSGEALESAARGLVREDEQVLAVLPTFVGEDDQ